MSDVADTGPGQSARVGDSVSFSAGVEGLEPFKYQWFKNGEAIAGATNSTLTLTAVKAQDAAQYAVVVNNQFGQARSTEASLLIRAPLAVQGDFDHDDLPDIVFQDQSGVLAIWHMTKPQMASAALLVPSEIGEPGWKVAGTGDFDQDGNEDLLLQHRDGTLAVWFMNGAKLIEARF